MNTNLNKDVMNNVIYFSLKVLRKLYAKSFGSVLENPICVLDPDEASKLIYNALNANEPCMIARFGSTELNCLANYLGIVNNKGKYFDYVKGSATAWWWNSKVISQMSTHSGFFPPTVEKIEHFCELMLQDIPQVDILGSWRPEEKLLEKELKNAHKINLLLLEPYWAENHWSRVLEGKKVLVVHPFSEDIEQQYLKRELLFEKNVLPQFELTTIKSVQSLAGEKVAFKDWFEALDYMKAEIDKVDYDICLIGCGAYGFHLAAHVKRSGKKGFHYGGALQLLFGIKGKRWENELYGKDVLGEKGKYPALFNEHWIYPGDKSKPKNANAIEGACYW